MYAHGGAPDDSTYVLDLHKQGGVELDSRSMGNVSRFLNSSCDPNLENRIDHPERRGGFFKTVLYALRDIPKGDELTWKYFLPEKHGQQVNKKRRKQADGGAAAASASVAVAGAVSGKTGMGRCRCVCGAKSCAG